MSKNRKLGLLLPWALAATLVALVVLTLHVTTVRSQGVGEHEREINEAIEAQETGSVDRQIQSVAENDVFPLFIGVDDDSIPSTYTIDPATNISATAFSGGVVWGAAYDPLNHRVLFNDGLVLYEWPIGGAVNSLGVVVDADDNQQSLVSLAFYEGQLYGTKNIANEAIWVLDPDTLVASVSIDYEDIEYDFGGLAVDPDTGDFYGTNDTSVPHGTGLFRINPDGTATQIAPYPAGETDIDGLAIGEGRAYLVTDEPGEIYVYDFDAGTYVEPLKNPWTTLELFSGAAWISPLVQPEIDVEPAAISQTLHVGATASRAITISNVGDGTLEWEIFEEAEAPAALPESVASTSWPEYVSGTHPPSAGAAPIQATEGASSNTPRPNLTNQIATIVRSQNHAYDGHFTLFNLETPEIVPNTAVFTGTGDFIGAGEFIDGLSYMVDDADNMFVLDDSGMLQAQYTVTAPPAGENYVGMALNPRTGEVYLSSTNVTTSSLFTVDPTTGNAELIGQISDSPGNVAIAFDGEGYLFGYDLVDDTFMQIDPADGSTSNVVPLPFDANFGQGMFYDPTTELLYMLAFNAGTFQAELWVVSTANPASPIFGFLDALGSAVPGSDATTQLTWGGTESCSTVGIPWVSVQPGSGAISAGASESVDVIFDASGLDAGVYEGTLCLRSNDLSNALLRVPLTMTVEPHTIYLPALNRPLQE